MSTARVPRTIILSDLHLGRPGGAGRARAFEALVGDCDRVIVNGDVAELHHARYQRDAERELDIFRDLCTSRGIRLDLVAGNHDPFVSDVRAIELADGAVYITHGDAFHPAIAPWSPYASTMREAFDRAFGARDASAREDTARFLAAREAAIAEWRTMGAGAHISTLPNMLLRPHRMAAVLAYWAAYPRLAADWATRFSPRAGTVVVGHSHRAFSRTVGARRVVNTGAYGFPGTPHAVVVEDGAVRLHRIVPRGPLYALASQPRDSWPIAEATDARMREGSGRPSTPPMNRAAPTIAPRSSDVS
jgi:predicted phosphodiesterase